MYRLCAAVGTSLVLVTGTAFAQSSDRDFDDDNTEGFYVGAGIGEFSTQIDNLDDVDDVDLDFDEDEDSSKIFAGWRFNRFVAVQADQYDFGESRTARNLLNVSSDTEGFATSIIGTLPLGPVELFARAGIVWYDLSVRIGEEDVVDESGNDAVYSAGVGFTVLERLNLKAEWEVIDINEFDDADAVWISASWRF